MVSVGIVDDHELIRLGLRSLLEQEPAMDCVLELTSAQEVLDSISKIDDTVDILLLDLSLPDSSGLSLLEKLQGRLQRTKVIILSSSPEEEFAVQAVRSGASGFLPKDFTVASLLEAVRSVMHGGIYLTPKASGYLREGTPADAATAPTRDTRELSGNELTVFRYICTGYANKEIAYEMGCSVKTVSTYKRRLMEKLGAGNLVELVRIGMEKGFVPDHS